MAGGTKIEILGIFWVETELKHIEDLKLNHRESIDEKIISTEKLPQNEHKYEIHIHQFPISIQMF